MFRLCTRQWFCLPLLLSALLSGCTSHNAAPSQSSSPKLYVMDCGSLRFSDVSAFGLTNAETPVREMFVPCYLIDHQGQQLLWDGGLPLAIAGKPASEPQPGLIMEYRRSVLEQLAQIGLTPADVELVAFSHFHFDHVGAANAFHASTLLIQETEYAAAFENAADYPTFDATLYRGLSNSRKVKLQGDHDVFGDGRVRIISAPGHTPGHQLLLIDLDETGKVMLSGDLYHFEFNRAQRRVPTFNTNREQTLVSMQKVEQMLIDEGATLWIEHSQALADSQRRLPEYYQ